MPTREHAPVGAPCWIDLTTSDPDRSRAFYGQLFGWEAEEPAEEFEGYFNYRQDGVLVAGCMTGGPEAQWHDVWSVYLASADTRKTAEVAVAHGAEMLVPPMDVGDLGTMAVLSDPGGAAVGVWQPGLHPGFGVHSEPGTPRWFEVLTRDYGPVVAFYRDVFGWDTQTLGDSDEFHYTALVHGDEMLAGIHDADATVLPEGTPSHWSVVFAVEDTDAALRTIVELGGTVLAPAADSPYGRLGTAADSTGAVFKVVG